LVAVVVSFLVLAARADQLHGVVAANAALPNKAAAGLDHQVIGDQLAMDMTTGNDFQTLAVNIAFHMTGDDDMDSLDGAFKEAMFTNGDIGFGLNFTFDAAVYVQVIT
jgi:hypothetical protein